MPRRQLKSMQEPKIHQSRPTGYSSREYVMSRNFCISGGDSIIIENASFISKRDLFDRDIVPEITMVLVFNLQPKFVHNFHAFPPLLALHVRVLEAVDQRGSFNIGLVLLVRSRILLGTLIVGNNLAL